MKRLWLLFIWLVLPPAFFFMSKKYGFKTWERWVLTIHSPSNLILIFVLFCTYIMWGGITSLTRYCRTQTNG